METKGNLSPNLSVLVMEFVKDLFDGGGILSHVLFETCDVKHLKIHIVHVREYGLFLVAFLRIPKIQEIQESLLGNRFTDAINVFVSKPEEVFA